jgi:hypothetical protein
MVPVTFLWMHELITSPTQTIEKLIAVAIMGGEVKVKFFLLIKHHAMKRYEGVEV